MDYSISQLTEDHTAADSDLIEVSKDNGNGTYTSRKQKRSTLLSGKASQADLNAHTGNTLNPHSVTKAQVGLSNADNTSDAAKPISTATQAALDAKANTTDLHSHSNKAVLDATTASFTTADETKLDGIASGATANSSDATLLNRANHTGTQSSSTIADFSEAVQDAVAALLAAGTAVTLNYDDVANTLTINSSGGGEGGGLDAEAVRDAIGVALIGSGLISVTVNDAADTITISTTATANDTDANLKNRTNHTGTQAISTVSGLQTALDGKAASTHAHAIADVTNLQTTLDGKAGDAHTHAIADVTGLQTTLDAKLEDVEVADINATGTADGTTYLRDDGTWSTPANGGTALPDQTGNAGKYLKTDGSALSWDTPAGGGSGSVDLTKMRHYIWNASADTNFITTSSGASASTDNGLVAQVDGAQSSSQVELGNKFPVIRQLGFWNHTLVSNLTTRALPDRATQFSLAIGGAPYHATVNYKLMGLQNRSGNLAFRSGDGTSSTDTNVSASLPTSTTIKGTQMVHTPGVNQKCYVDGTLTATHTTSIPSGDGYTDSPYFRLYLNSNYNYGTLRLGVVELWEQWS